MNEVYPNDDGPQNYPMFTARYPEWVWRYYLSTGDRATLAGLLPDLVRLSDYICGTIDASTGLISGQPMSTNGDQRLRLRLQHRRRHDPEHRGASTPSTGSATVATLLGDAATAAIQTQRAAALAAAVNAQLIGGDGLYVDGLRTDGQQSAHVVAAGQRGRPGLRGGPPGPGCRGGGLCGLARHPPSSRTTAWSCCGPSTPAGGMPTWSGSSPTRSFPGWAVIIEAGGTFTWETWTPSDLIGDSMSHGWGSSALVAMQEVLLGAVPTRPGTEDRPPWSRSPLRPVG